MVMRWYIMVMRWYSNDDDDDEWWYDDDDDMMMMIKKRIPKEIFKRNPSQTLLGKRKREKTCWRLKSETRFQTPCETPLKPSGQVFETFHDFWTFKQEPYDAKHLKPAEGSEIWNLRSNFRTTCAHWNRRKKQIFDARPSFSLRGVQPAEKKTQKTISYQCATKGSCVHTSRNVDNLFHFILIACLTALVGWLYRRCTPLWSLF